MVRASKERLEIDLNSAPEQLLARLPGIGPRRAQWLIHHRPYRSWNDLDGLQGLNRSTIEQMREAGATIARREPLPGAHR